jgi:ethanolamine utilization protein EutA (predicted chaperonin)
MGAEAAAIVAAIASATKACGVVVKMEPEEFQKILSKTSKSLVVCATGGLISTNYQYLTTYKGLAFFTKSHEPLTLPPGVETVIAEDIWLPG